MLCQVEGFNSGDLKNDLYFHFRVSPTPARGPLGRGREPRGDLVLYYQNIDSGVFNSGEFKNDLYFHFRVPPTPARVPPGEG